MTARAKAATSTIGDALEAHRDISVVSTSPLFDCQVMLSHVLGVTRSWLYTHLDDTLEGDALAHFEALLVKRRAGRPVAYLVGHHGFWTMDVEVTPATLVPRPETELLVESLLVRLDASRKVILDAGTGTGAIAIAVARERPGWDIYASDMCALALEVAARNIERLAPRRVALLRANWLEAIASQSLDAIVSNPPYIRVGDEHLHALAHEPCQALVGGTDGLDAISEIIAKSGRCLRPGGLLITEHGYDQAYAVKSLARRHGFTAIETLHDLNDQPRVLIAGKPQ